MELLQSLTRLLLLVVIVDAQGDPPKNIEPDLSYPRQPDSPYSYPSPNTTGRGGWDVAFAKAKRLVDLLTVEEKVKVCSGNGSP